MPLPRPGPRHRRHARLARRGRGRARRRRRRGGQHPPANAPWCGEAARARDILQLHPTFRGEPLLYTPLSNGSNPHLRSVWPRRSCLAANLRVASSRHHRDPAAGPRMPGQAALRATHHRSSTAISSGCKRAAGGSRRRLRQPPARSWRKPSRLLEPFLGIWMNHSKTLRVACSSPPPARLEPRRRFHQAFRRTCSRRLPRLANIEAVLSRGVSLPRLRKNNATGARLRWLTSWMIDHAAEAERFCSSSCKRRELRLVQGLCGRRPSRTGGSLYQYLDFLRLRRATTTTPGSSPLEPPAGAGAKARQTAALWRQRCSSSAGADHLKELARIEEKHGMRLRPSATARRNAASADGADRLCADRSPPWSRPASGWKTRTSFRSSWN